VNHAGEFIRRYSRMANRGYQSPSPNGAVLQAQGNALAQAKTR
jgi:hypothetical protein